MGEKTSGRFRKKRVNFSMVSNHIIRDKTISLRAKGLYALIQSYITIENFTLYKSFLMSHCSEGERAFNTAWNELKETGYLKAYKIREGSRYFTYEYELLDEPEKPQSVKSVDLQNVGIENVGIENSQCRYTECNPTQCNSSQCSITQSSANNTVKNNTIENNTYRIISFDDVTRQIDLSNFSVFDEGQAQEIALLITDIFNVPDDSVIRITGQNQQAYKVKERFRLLDHYHVQYVLDSLKDTKTQIRNKRNYLITALYNAPTTLETSYQNEINNS